MGSKQSIPRFKKQRTDANSRGELHKYRRHPRSFLTFITAVVNKATMHDIEIMAQKCANQTPTVMLSWSTAAISSLLILATVPSNLLICLAILIDPNRRLRTQFNCFTFNLALADLIVGSITEPTSVWAHVEEALATTRGENVSQVLLNVFHVPYFISAMASALSIGALASERYMAVTAPFQYRKYFSVNVAIMVSTFIWITSLTFGSLSLIFGYLLESFIFINSGILLTSMLVSLACFRIHSVLRESSKEWNDKGTHHTREEKHQIHLTKTFAYMLGSLVLCYVPASCMVYIVYLSKNIDCSIVSWLNDIIFWFILLHSAINPYVFAIRSQAFRQAIAKISCCHCFKKNRLNLMLPKRPINSSDNKARFRYGTIDIVIGTKAEDGDEATLIQY